MWGGKYQRIPDTCWPANLVDLVSYSLRERPCLKKIKWIVTEEDIDF